MYRVNRGTNHQVARLKKRRISVAMLFPSAKKDEVHGKGKIAPFFYLSTHHFPAHNSIGFACPYALVSDFSAESCYAIWP